MHEPWLTQNCLHWIVLIGVALFPYGLYWAYDIPGSIQTQITNWFGGPTVYTSADNLLLYSVYSYPNVIMPFFAGYFFDKFTVRLGATVVSGVSLVGQIGFSVGIQTRTFWLCVLGRIFFGVGEALVVAQSKYANRWFTGNQTGFLFGFIAGLSRLGTVINFATMPLLANLSVPVSVWLGTIMCFLSFLAAAILGFIDKTAEERSYVQKNINKDQTLKQVIYSLKEITEFPILAWLILCTSPMFYASFILFSAMASDIMQHTGVYYSPTEASLYLAIPNMVGIISPPIFGKITDIVGKTLWWGIGGSFLFVLGLVLFLLASLNWVFIHPVVVMIVIGLGYSIYVSAYWPLMTFVVDEGRVGRAYGLSNSIENFIYVVLPPVIGYIQTSDGILGTTNQYFIPIDIILFFGVLAFVMTIIIFIVDGIWYDGVLNSSSDMKYMYKEILNERDQSNIVEAEPEVSTEDIPLLGRQY